MSEKIRVFFMKNIIWKIAALFMAIILWFIAVNIENPIKTRTISLSVGLKNEEILEENNMVLLNRDALLQTRINLRITGQTRTVDALKAEDIFMHVDISEIYQGNFGNSYKAFRARVRVDFPKGVDNIDFTLNIDEIDVVIDFLDTREFMVLAKLIGELEEDFIYSDPVITPAVVNITGARSILDSIKDVFIEADITGLDNDFVANRALVIYDINNQNITNKLKTDINMLNLNLAVNKISRIFINMPNVRGSVAAGFSISNITLSQNFIEVSGKVEDILSLGAINLAPVDISLARSTVTAVYDLTSILEEHGLTIKEEFDSYVEVRVFVEQEVTRTFNVPIENFEIIGDTTYALFEDYVEVKLIGKNEHVFLVNEAVIKGHIDISELDNGVHQVFVHVDAIENTQRVSSSYTTVTIKQEAEEVEEDESEEDSNLDIEE